jgi:hypothetical protein
VLEGDNSFDIEPQPVSWKRIEKGAYLPKFQDLSNQQYDQAIRNLINQGIFGTTRPQDSTTIPEAIAKPFHFRSSLEHNLLFGVVFKMLKQIEPAASKLFAVIAALTEHLTTKTYT